MNEEFDPTIEIGISGAGLSEEETAEAVINMQEAEQERAASREQEAQEDEARAEANKPDEKANLGDYIADTVKAPIAGVRDAAANLITVPERVIDFYLERCRKKLQLKKDIKLNGIACCIKKMTH